MAAERKFCLGNEAFVDEDFDTAIKCYSEAIEIEKENPDYFLKRCNAYIKKENFEDAIKDADCSIQLKHDDSRPHQRRGFALFSMKKYEEALQSYTKALALNDGNEQLKQWIRKCEAEINLTGKCHRTKNRSSVGFSKLHKPCKEEKQETIKPSQAKVENENTQSNKVQASSAKDLTCTPAPKIKHDWYQTETHVVISVMVKKLKTNDVNTEFTEQTLSLTAKLPSGSDYSLELDLAHPIVPKESISKVLSTKIEIKMKKKEGIRWSSLETDDESKYANSKTNTGPIDEDAVHKYPTSRHLYTDWDRLAKEVMEEEKKEDSEGDAALNKLFQQIYSDGNDEVKRAMNKSFQQSGGTVLSTNWSEVKKEQVEVKPPDSMEYKKYEY